MAAWLCRNHANSLLGTIAARWHRVGPPWQRPPPPRTRRSPSALHQEGIGRPSAGAAQAPRRSRGEWSPASVGSPWRLAGSRPPPLVSRQGWRRSLGWRSAHIGHGEKVPELGDVVERVPVAYLDRGNANRHGVLLVVRVLFGSARHIVNLRQLWQGRPDIARAVASVDRGAFDTHDQ